MPLKAIVTRLNPSPGIMFSISAMCSEGNGNCLICGKFGHGFRNFYLLNKGQMTNIIMCIAEEDDIKAVFPNDTIEAKKVGRSSEMTSLPEKINIYKYDERNIHSTKEFGKLKHIVYELKYIAFSPETKQKSNTFIIDRFTKLVSFVAFHRHYEELINVEDLN